VWERSLLEMLAEAGFVDGALLGWTGYRTSSCTRGALVSARKPEDQTMNKLFVVELGVEGGGATYDDGAIGVRRYPPSAINTRRSHVVQRADKDR
jgi:hypothetical protein